MQTFRLSQTPDATLWPVGSFHTVDEVAELLELNAIEARGRSRGASVLMRDGFRFEIENTADETSDFLSSS